MEKEIKKITDEDLKKITDLDFELKKVTLDFGKIAIEERFLTEQLNSLEATKEIVLGEYKKLQEQEISLHEYMQKTYGNGVLDLNTGMFTIE